MKIPDRYEMLRAAPDSDVRRKVYRKKSFLRNGRKLFLSYAKHHYTL